VPLVVGETQPQSSKLRLYKNHVKPFFADLYLDEIGVAQIAQFRAVLVEGKQRKVKCAEMSLSDKYINNILAVVSKALKYAEDVQIIQRAPKVGIFRTERPEIECWDFEQYARLLDAAKAEGPEWYAAVCLAGDAGLRISEVKGLRWREDVDLIAGTMTINRQIQEGREGTPKGRTRRVVPITDTLDAALRGIGRIRTGYVVCNMDGSPLSVGMVNSTIHRICRRAGLPRGDVRRQSVDPHDLDGAQADRRDDALCPLRRRPPAAFPSRDPRSRRWQSRPGGKNRQNAGFKGVVAKARRKKLRGQKKAV
jgi:integrase